MVDKKTFAIGVLSLSAVILLVANILAPRPVVASYDTIKDNDYQIQVATAIQGGDAVYITENRTGMMASFVYDPNRHTMVPQAMKPVQDAFAGMTGTSRTR